MSYDLGFVARAGTGGPALADVETVLRGLANVTYANGQGLYENRFTGVYFTFDCEDDPAAPMTLALNIGRPSYFGLEAAEAVEAVVTRLQLDVDDHQAGTTGPFDREAFLTSWNAANQAGCRLFGESEESGRYPRSRMVDLWRWNRFVQATANKLDGHFVCQGGYRKTGAAIRSYASLFPGIPTIVPDVDDITVMFRRISPSGESEFEGAVATLAELSALSENGFEELQGNRCLRFGAATTVLATTMQGRIVPQAGLALTRYDDVLDAEYFDTAVGA